MSRGTQEPAQRASQLSSTGLSPSLAGLSRPFDSSTGFLLAGLAAQQALQPRRACTTVWAAPRSLAATSGITVLFSLPGGTEMVHFPALPSWPYDFRPRYGGMTHRGFPHSDILGSKPVCDSPRLFAANRVLHRLLVPRHPPYALSSLTIKSTKN